MNTNAVHYILSSKADDLERALASLHAAQARQERVKVTLPDAYDDAFHAAGVAQHIQGISSNLACLLNQAIEQTDGEIPKSETWQQDLVRLAVVGTSKRAPLIDDVGANHIARAFQFVLEIQSPFAADIEPSRVFQQIPNVDSAVQAAVTGVRRMLRLPAATSSTNRNVDEGARSLDERRE